MLCLLQQGIGQTSTSMPMYKGGYPTASRVLEKKIWGLFEETHSNGFVSMSFDVLENGDISNISFSKNFPQKISSYIVTSFHSEPAEWNAATYKKLSVAKKIVWPIIYQYGGSNNYLVDMDMIFNALDFVNTPGVNKGIIDAIVMPVCMTGFKSTKK
jgi:hypothetical protein